MQSRWDRFPRVADLRGELDLLTERIIFRLSDRRKFPLNRAAWQKDAVPVAGRSGTTFLDYALEGLETYHATLGRFEYPDQFPLSRAHLPRPAVTREVRLPQHPAVLIPLRERLLPFYLDTVLSRIATGDDPQSYGETAYLDAELLAVLNMRINKGRYIAIDKVRENPGLWQFITESDRVRALLSNPGREDKVMKDACATAAAFGIEQSVAELVFRWVIAQTLDLEVEYLQGIARQFPELTR